MANKEDDDRVTERHLKRWPNMTFDLSKKQFTYNMMVPAERFGTYWPLGDVIGPLMR